MKRVFAVFVAAAPLLLAGGCGGSSADLSARRAMAGAGAEAYPVTVGDLTIARRPGRIVSLAPTATEVLYAIGAGPQVVAVDDQSNYPTTAPLTDLSGAMPNAAAIAAKKPDLVVLADDRDKIVSRLGELKIPVLLTPAATTMDDAYREIGQVGALTGHRAEAEALHLQMSASINRIVKGVPTRRRPLSYYYELDPTLYTVTSRTFIGSIFSMFGMADVADAADPTGVEGGYPKLSPDALIKSDPDVIFLADDTCCGQSAQTVGARQGWKTITAVTLGHVFPLDDDIAARWGPRTVDFVQSIADALAKLPA